MKKFLFLLALVVFVGGCRLGVDARTGTDHSGVSIKARTELEGTSVDTRRELKLPQKVKVKQKAMMRKHLDTISEITRALADNDLEEAGTIAGEKLGWNEDEEKKCKAVAKKTGEDEFLTLGRAVHKKADELSGYALAGDKDKALLALSELINSCNGCHKVFRH